MVVDPDCLTVGCGCGGGDDSRCCALSETYKWECADPLLTITQLLNAPPLTPTLPLTPTHPFTPSPTLPLTPAHSVYSLTSPHPILIFTSSPFPYFLAPLQTLPPPGTPPYAKWEIPLFILMGVLFGYLAHAYLALHQRVSVFMRPYNRQWPLLTAAGVAVVTAGVVYVTGAYSGDSVGTRRGRECECV
jgi:hypothetical protein